MRRIREEVSLAEAGSFPDPLRTPAARVYTDLLDLESRYTKDPPLEALHTAGSETEIVG